MRADRHLPDEIVVPPRLRAGLNEASIEALASSIRQIGLRTPITVREQGDGINTEIVLVAGRHRLEACKRLGIELIDCVVFDGTEVEARQWEIAENLHRAELTAVERAEHIEEWIKLEADKVAQSAPPAGGRQPKEQGIRKAARQLGVSRREAQRAAKIAVLPETVRDQARTEHWSQSRLLAATKPPRDPQNDIEVENKQVDALMRAWNAAGPRARERFLELVDRPVFDRTPIAAAS